MENAKKNERFLEILPSLGTYRSLLCLNGTLPGSDFFSLFNLPIIAADGAYDLLQKKNITADIIIGDCDSVKGTIGEKTKKIAIGDQSFSDFQKALKFLREARLLPSIVLGIGGGCMDHILNNISILAQTDSVAYMPPTLGFGMDNSMALSLPRGTKLSLFGMPSGRISTRGLRWELENQMLYFHAHNSCFNRTLGERVTFEVHEGKIFLVIYLKNVIDEGYAAALGTVRP
ncbi:MAG: thiamine diphosphokinase [Puniceicoccales bacterium]|nr:thiamine diphosphokinase [Puniceicoccales bacterium]